MKILLVLDGSSGSNIALEKIAARPWPQDATFDVVSVAEPSHLWTSQESARESVCRAEGVVARAVAHLQSQGQKATGTTLSGNPRSLILERATSIQADFIVVGAHGDAVFRRSSLGSLATVVLHHAHCSVSIIRAPLEAEPRSEMRVLLATDGSEFSECAAQSIAERPWPSGTEIRVFSSVELILPVTQATMGLPFFDPVFVESARAKAMKRSQDAITRANQVLSTANLEVSESLSVLLDTPKAVILDEASSWNADLIVLGSHGYSGMDRFLLGSVSEAVATHAHCSVEVIRKIA